MIRVVLDTVVFVRALISPGGPSGRICFELSGRYTLVASPGTIAEMVETTQRPRLLGRYPRMSDPARLRKVLDALSNAEFVESPPPVTVCRDPDDDKFFACAIAGGADYIVSEDQDILAVAEHEGVRTISASAFIALLTRERT